MCQNCEIRLTQQESRRNFLKAATVGFGAALVGSSSWPVIAAGGPPPKPENVMSPDAALARLLQGNARYVKGIETPDSFKTMQPALFAGQNPYACILGCADSRVSPELCFDENQGDLFVTRVAGNFVTTEILASLEYGTAVLNSPLIMVLGHTNCGAVGAAIKATEKHEDFPGHIQTLASAISPAVKEAIKKDPKNVADYATRQNVRNNVIKLREATPLISARVENGQLRVVGGLYDLKTGRVDLIEA